VEVTFRLPGQDGSILELPSRPSFYDGIEPYNNDMDVDDEDWWMERDQEDEDAESMDDDIDADDDDVVLFR
jgi:hypothetical protein